MTRILIVGGGGMIGQKLAGRIVNHGLGQLRAPEITLFDIGFLGNAISNTTNFTGNIAEKETVQQLISQRFDVIFHLASIVSGEAEVEFDKGWSTNMGGMMHLLDSLRTEHLATGGTYKPKLIFTSSIAVFGDPYPAQISDTFFQSPQTSYGAQKAICEIMLQDHHRKGFVDGVSLRLPTICVRPGKPNLAASSFFSGIIREPINGQETILPVPDTVRHWHASPRSAAKFLTHAAVLKTEDIGKHRALNLPGVSCTVAEQIEALRDVVGQEAVNLIKPQINGDILSIVSGWPRDFDPRRALDLGFEVEGSFEDIIRTYLKDDT